MGQVTADFIASDTSGCGSVQVNFSDQSTTNGQAIISYIWTLGIANSTLQNPGAIYTEPGSYTVCLTVTDAAGNEDTKCKDDFIQVYATPNVDFTVDVTEGCSPVIATYTNQSSSSNGNLVSMLWDVGGSTNVISTSDPTEDIVTTYTNQGLYSATLVVIDEKGCQNTLSKSELVTVNGIEDVLLDVNLIQSCELPWIIDFENLTPDPAATYTWDFGNGQTYVGQNPDPINFDSEGQFDLKIYMQKGSCLDTMVFENIVNTSPERQIEISPSVVCAGSITSFRESSSILADSVIWMFGDGEISTVASPSHQYESEGCYDITLIRFTNGCVDTTSLSCLTVMPGSDVSYTIDNQYTCTLPAILSVSGSSTSSGQFSWVYGNQDTIETANANFDINQFGTSFLTLLFFDDNGCTFTADSVEVVAEPFEIDFPTNGPQGCIPLEFTLSDSIISANNIIDWQWSIDQGTLTSDLPSPTFTISETGRFDVELIATNAIGCTDTVVATEYIRTGSPPMIDFEATPLSGCRKDVRSFTDLTVGDVDEWQWIFGDESYSDLQNPGYEFNYATLHNVTLIVTTNGCSDTLTKHNYIEVLEPNSEFVLEYSCENPYEVAIKNVTIGADSLHWEIDLGTGPLFTSTDSIIGSFTFPGRGKYPMGLFSKNDSTGCDDIQLDTIHIVDPIAGYTVDTLRGCSPLTVNITESSTDGFFYEYLSSGTATIDTTNYYNPSITFYEGGRLLGPTLIITDIHSCTDTFQLSDSVVVNQLVAAATYDEVVCIPAEVDFLDSSTDLLGTITEWEWKLAYGTHIDSSQNTTYNYQQEGYYDLQFRVLDDWGCRDSILIPQAIFATNLEPDFFYDSLGCTFAPIRFVVTSSNQFVDEYLWEFGDGETSVEKNPNHIYAQEGIYSVCLTLFDSRGCSKSICKEQVVVIKDPIAQYTADPTLSICPPLFSQFENTSVNSTTYQWNFGDDTGLSSSDNPGHVYTAPGVFDVSLVAYLTPMCTDTLTIPEFINVDGPIADFRVDYDPTCIPQPILLIAESDKEYDYVWDFGDGVLDSTSLQKTADSILYEYHFPGSFAPKLIITDDQGCTRSFSEEAIMVDQVILETAIADTVVCGLDLPILFSNMSAGTTDEVQYKWVVQSSADTTILDGFETQMNLTNVGEYSVLLVAEYGGCIDTLKKDDYFEVGYLPEAAFQLEQQQFCNNVDVQLVNTSTITSGNISEWLWEFPDGTTSTLESPTYNTDDISAATIALTAISEIGCIGETSETFVPAPGVEALAGPDQQICQNQETTLNGSLSDLDIGATYSWSESAGLSCIDCLTPTVNVSETTQYVLTVVHPNGCISTDTVIIQVTAMAQPLVDLAADSIICEGTSTTIHITNFDSDNSYSWDPTAEGLDCYNDCPTVIASPEIGTNYFLEVTNSQGCTSYDSIFIDVEVFADSLIEDRKAICQGNSTILTVVTGQNPQWEQSSTLDCTNCATPTATPSETTTYYVTVETPMGCLYRDSILVEVLVQGAVNAGQDMEICKGEAISVSGTANGEISWSPASLFDNPTALSSAVFVEETTTLMMQMTDDECTQSDSLLITVLTKADIEVAGDSICYGEEAFLSHSGFIDNVEWYESQEFLSSEDDLYVTPETTTTYTAIGHYRTCEPDTAIAIVQVAERIDFSFEKYQYDIYQNTSEQVIADYDRDRDYEFDWAAAEGLSCNNCSEPKITYVDGRDEYILTIIDLETGCEEVVSIDVRQQDGCSSSVIGIPNIFSMNGPSAGPGFGAITNNKDEFISLHLFDRWGNLVYQSEDVDNHWHGMINGEEAAAGVYVYIMRLICPESNEEYYLRGDVTLVK